MKRAPAAALFALLFFAAPAHARLASHASAPAFKASAVDGAAVDLRALLARGPVVLDFWATWCHPCAQAMPSLERMHERLGARGLTIVGVSVDGPRNFARVQPFARRMGLKFPIVRDEDGSLQALYQVVEVPTTLVIAPDGKVAAVFTGFRPGQDAEIEAAVEALLAAESAAAPADSTR